MRWFIYSVLLILILTAGCDVLPFGGNEPPVAYIDSISPSEAAAGETVAFVGHGTDADGTVVGYKWRSYVDGDLSTLATFNSSELSEGEHTIYLSVQDNNGDWSEEVASNIIVGATSEGFTEEGAFEEVETGTPSEDTTSTELPYINYLTAEPAVISRQRQRRQVERLQRPECDRQLRLYRYTTTSNRQRHGSTHEDDCIYSVGIERRLHS